MKTLEQALQWAFGAPGRIQQHESEFREFIGRVEKELKPRRTVELGTWRGTTAALLSHVTSDIVVSLDIQDYGGKDEALAISGRTRPTYKLSSAREQETVDATMRLLGGEIDLLFIDDGHRIEEVTEEHKLWAPMVRIGGWIVFHDINPDANKDASGNHPDICQAHAYWKRLIGPKEEIVFHGNPPGPGIGILKV